MDETDESSREEVERLGPYQLREQVPMDEPSRGELFRARNETSGATALLFKPVEKDGAERQTEAGLLSMLTPREALSSKGALESVGRLHVRTKLEGWIRTRDLGYVDGDGYVHLVGRARNVASTRMSITRAPYQQGRRADGGGGARLRGATAGYAAGRG